MQFCVFDWDVTPSHNRRVTCVHRAFAVALLAALFAAPCLGVCAGWEAIDHARMACCADKAQDEADACCASGEARQGIDVLAGLLVAVLPVPAVDAHQVESILTASQIFTARWDSHAQLPSDSDRHVLLSVFLI